jgi:hypothetical protein
MVSSFAVKGDGIQKEQHKVALGLEILNHWLFGL